MAAATPAEQVERLDAFDTYERGLIAHVQELQAPVVEAKPAQPKSLRLKVNPCEGNEGENLHFWVREVELAMDAALISTERRRVTFALSNLGVFMDGLKVGPSRTQLFRVHANTMEEAIQIALQEEYSHRPARAVQGAPAARASTGPVHMELGTAVQSSIRCYGCGKLGHMQRACPAGEKKFPSKPRDSRGQWQKPRPKSQGNWGHQ
ncbi:Gag protein [Phytophthora palmivora]|uniref:Gag protein n=1 Tax=Phytophthora palmivora TaxID=4796 RepID=A0A2P4X3U5_9STRA|nr:Gag protein [Phytophthora palmivora]